MGVLGAGTSCLLGRSKGAALLWSSDFIILVIQIDEPFFAWELFRIEAKVFTHFGHCHRVNFDCGQIAAAAKARDHLPAVILYRQRSTTSRV